MDSISLVLSATNLESFAPQLIARGFRTLESLIALDLEGAEILGKNSGMKPAQIAKFKKFVREMKNNTETPGGLPEKRTAEEPAAHCQIEALKRAVTQYLNSKDETFQVLNSLTSLDLAPYLAAIERISSVQASLSPHY